MLSLLIISCSLNKNSKIWNKKDIKVEENKNLKIVLDEKKISYSELNPNIKLDLPNISFGADFNSKSYAAIIFSIFVITTLLITYYASKKTYDKKNYYAAGEKISGLQNGLAIAGDYMSAASFLGISGLVFFSGFDGLIYSIGFLVGWPIILFLIAEKLKNLGKYKN